MMKQETQRKDLEVIVEEVMNKHDTYYNDWNEPTDGTFTPRPGYLDKEEEKEKKEL